MSSAPAETKSTASSAFGPSFRIGWREFVALPNLGLPVLKAKVDTGARTSALHAFKIEPFTREGRAMVRFHVHPIQRRNDIVVICEAPVIDQRMVADSGGHRERRYVIATQLVISGRRSTIEVTLTNRESMVFRMLLGRTAMQSLSIEPGESYLLGRPEKIIRAYRKTSAEKGLRHDHPAQADETSEMKASHVKRKKKNLSRHKKPQAK